MIENDGKIPMLDGKVLNMISISNDLDKFELTKVKVDNLVTNFSHEFQNAIIGKDSKNTQTIKDFSSLKRTIQNYGQLIPIIISSVGGNKYQVIDGLKRVNIAKRLGMNEMNAIVIDDDLNTSSSVIRLFANQRVARNIDGTLQEFDDVRNETDALPREFIEDIMGHRKGDLEYMHKLLAIPDAKRIALEYKKGSIDLEKAKHKLDRLLENESERDNSEDGTLDNNSKNLDTLLNDHYDQFDNQKMNSNNQNDDAQDEIEVLSNGEQQFIGKRHRLDQELRKIVIERDHSTCQICGLGQNAPFIRPQFEIHHLIEVQFGGHDEVNNLITLCASCHKLITNHGVGDYKYVNPEFRQPDFDPTPNELDQIPQYWGIMVLADIEKEGSKLAMNELFLRKPRTADLVRMNKMTIGQGLAKEHLVVDFPFDPYQKFIEGVIKLAIMKKDIGYKIINSDIANEVDKYHIESEFDESTGSIRKITRLVKND